MPEFRVGWGGDVSNNGEVKIRISTEAKAAVDDLNKVESGLADVGASANKAGASLASSKPAMDNLGMSAKATSAALRGVPAQFTDIVTSLQGGQSPLTVLMQQGGQLKDMFGGVGAATRALGGYVLGLINPFTVAAGTVAALGVAYSQGADESAAFTRTLILSGNVAGATAGQLMDMSRSVAASSGATRGTVAEAMNEAAASGKIPLDMMARVTQAAIEMERAGGAAAAETVKEFAALGGEPVAAILKLNEKYRFLTASVYEQVKALSDQGRETDAAALAQSTYFDVLNGRIPALNANLGALEKAWRGVKEAAKWAWDSMLGIGREEGLEAQLAKAQQKVLYMSRTGSAEELAAYKPYQDAQLEVDSLKERIGLQRKLTTETGAANAQREADLNASVARGKDQGKTGRAPRAGKAEDPELDALIAHSDEMTRIRREMDAELKSIAQQDAKGDRAGQIVANYNAQSAMLIERIARQRELIGVSEREVQVKQALYKVDDEAAQVIKEITLQVKDETERKKALAEVEDGLAEKKPKVAAATRESYDAARTFEAGWTTAFTRYTDEAGNAAKTADLVFTKATDGMADAIATFVTTGKSSFSSLANAMIADLIRIQMKAALAPITNGLGGWLSGLFASTPSGVESTAEYVSGLNSVPGRAAGGRVFAGGTYLVGENGPERVRMNGNGHVTPSGSGSSAPPINVTVINQGAADGYQASTKTRQNNGNFDVEVLISKALLSDQKRNGPITQGFGQMFGLRQAV